MQRYWSSLLRYCSRDSVFVGCRTSWSHLWPKHFNHGGLVCTRLVRPINNTIYVVSFYPSLPLSIYLPRHWPSIYVYIQIHRRATFERCWVWDGGVRSCGCLFVVLFLSCCCVWDLFSCYRSHLWPKHLNRGGLVGAGLVRPIHNSI